VPAVLHPDLLDWYRDHRRTMPWREHPTPYNVWLSEVMLQQTRVDTGTPYWQRFRDRWPTVQALAAATLDEVLAEWSGLGYYRRARNLHRTAAVIAERGAFPDTVAGLRQLPGVGPYTAAAIASICFGRDVAVVDGNVERVLSRLHALDEDPRSGPGRRRLRALAEQHLLPGRAGDHNQALMELGALVCTPRAPTCGACPVAVSCRARARGEPERWPRRRPRSAVKRVSAACGAWRRGEEVLMARRPPEGLLGGLWELPGLEGDSGPDLVVRAFRERLGVEARPVAELGRVVHVFTHRHLTLHVYEVEARGLPRPLGYPEVRWMGPGEVAGGALSTLARKTLRLLQG